MFAYINNQFVPADKASLGINDLSILRGYGIFDFFRTRNNQPLFLDEYLDRFFESAAKMFLQPVPLRSQLREIIFELIEKNNIPESGIRIILTGGYTSDGYSLSVPNLIISQQAIKMPTNEMVANGVKIITHEYVREMPLVKSLNYNMGVWLQQKVKAMDAYDVLYHNNNCISEFPRANIFIVNKEGTLVTPAKDVLFGVTRKQVIRLAATQYKVEEREISLADINSANEVFITSTTRRLLLVNQVDDIVIGNGKAGPVYSDLYKAFMELEESSFKK